MQSSRAPVNPWSYYPRSVDTIACFLSWSLPAVNSWCPLAQNTALLSFMLSPLLLSVCTFSLGMPTHLWLQLLAHQQPPLSGQLLGPWELPVPGVCSDGSSQDFSWLLLTLASAIPACPTFPVPCALSSIYRSLSCNVLTHLLLVCISTKDEFQEGREFHLCCYLFSI